MVARHHARVDDRGDLDGALCASQRVLDPHPLAVGHAKLLCSFGMYFDIGPRIHATQTLDLAMLGMERAPTASAGGQHKRILVHEFRRGARAGARLFEVRHRVESAGVVERAPQLDAASGGVEARLSVGAQKTLLVTLVLERQIHRRLFAHFGEGHARGLNHVGQHVLDGAPRPRFGVEALANHQVDLGVGLRLADGGHLVDDLAALQSIAQTKTVFFGIGAGGQYHIGACHSRRRHEQVNHHIEVGSQQRFQHTLRIGTHAGDGVVGLQPHAMDLVGLVGLHRLDQLVGLRNLEAQL